METNGTSSESPIYKHLQLIMEVGLGGYHTLLNKKAQLLLELVCRLVDIRYSNCIVNFNSNVLGLSFEVHKVFLGQSMDHWPWMQEVRGIFLSLIC